jgi:hypothetical protein
MVSQNPVSKADTGLEHLVIVPTEGLANRMRAIASAKRLCELSGARCTVVWNWQDYEALFAPDPAIEVVPRIPQDAVGTHRAMQTKTTRQGGTPENRRIPLDGPPRIIMTSPHAFGATSDGKAVDTCELVPWIPRPSQAVLERVRQFKSDAFPAGTIVGMHMRRTDNDVAILRSPDRLFIRQAKRLADAGTMIYLATDNRRTERKMLAHIGGSIVMYPKNSSLARRWPRVFSLEETMEDYADLLLLASCDYVLGSMNSSYSRLAMALNASPRCRTLQGPDSGWMRTTDELRAAFRDRRYLQRRLHHLRRRLQPGIGIGRAFGKVWNSLSWRR